LFSMREEGDDQKRHIDAFSTTATPRPMMVLTPDKADDVMRHRFSAAHELGHLVLHRWHQTRDAHMEREADAFAAEFLTPRDELARELPQRFNLTDARISPSRPSPATASSAPSPSRDTRARTHTCSRTPSHCSIRSERRQPTSLGRCNGQPRPSGRSPEWKMRVRVSRSCPRWKATPPTPARAPTMTARLTEVRRV